MARRDRADGRVGAPGRRAAEVQQVGGEPLAAPSTAKLYRWDAGRPVVTDGPYSEAKEHFAGFFLVDVETQERAEAIAARLSGPGETVELRMSMSDGGDDQ